MRFLTLLREKAAGHPSIKGWFLKRMITDYPLAINIETTNHCNMKCTFCPRGYLRKAKGRMDIGLYKKIIDTIREDKRKVHIFLHNFGEPLLHPNLCEMIAYAKEKSAAKSIQFSTNGLLLKGDLAKGLIDAGADEITVSIDAATDISYRRLKGVKLDLVEENIMGFMRLKKQLGAVRPHVRVKILVSKDNADEVKFFKRKWRRLADSVTLDWHSEFGGLLASQGDARQMERYACANLWYRLVVGWDGTAVSCCVDINDGYPLGNLRERSIMEVWTGEEMQRLRMAHLQGRWDGFQPCASCEDWRHMPNIDSWLRSKG